MSFSPLDELVSPEAAFRAVMDDPDASKNRGAIERVVLCSGKVYYDLKTARDEGKDASKASTAIVRVEQLYPFPAEALASVIASYGSRREVVWAQEEARNMGTWTFMALRLPALLPSGVPLRYAGRAPSAATATGNSNVHKKELAELLGEALR